MTLEIPIDALVTREELGLPDLDINDNDNYIVGPNLAPGVVAWQRLQASSPFMHGAVTVGRRKDIVTAEIAVDILANNFTALTAAKQTIVEAFEQDSFRLKMTFEGSQYEWACEAADHGVSWEHPRVHARRLTVLFSFPRQPIPLLGV
jgi:hypothetical protein